MPAPAVRLDVVSRCADLVALWPELVSLWERDAEADAFRHPAWWIPWARHFAGGEPRVGLVRAGPDLVAALPLYERLEAGGPMVRFVGCSTTDYLDALLDGRWTGPASAALAGWLDEIEGSVDLVDLPSDGRVVRIVRECRRRVEIGACDRCPRAQLPADVARWRRQLSKNLTRNIDRYGRALAEAGATISRADPHSLAADLDAFLELHAARWQPRGQPGALADASVAAFHRDAARGLCAADLVRLYTMRINGRCIASQYVLTAHGASYAYLAGFDPEWARLSPGTVLIAHAIEDAIGEGSRVFDMLRGEEPYKTRWTNEVQSTVRAWFPALEAHPT